jgi:L-asparaginase
MSDRPRVALIACGGTIDAVGASRLDLAFYTETRDRLPAGSLLAALPELAEVAHVDEVPYRRVPSYALTAADLTELAGTVGELLERDGPGGYDGVVVTHGTNTIEETAFALHLTVHSPKPVVLVGAMRPASALGGDGMLNLLRAVQVAAAPRARDLGVLVVLNDTVHSARTVTKTATFRVDAFRSPDAGPLGYADADGRVVFYQRPATLDERPSFAPAALAAMPRVDIVVSYLGADGVLIDAAVAGGARGIVSAGTGAGRATPAEDAALDRAVDAGVVVCQATRVGSGRVARSPAMAARRLVAAENLVPWKARILLGLGLTRTADPETLTDLFARI